MATTQACLDMETVDSVDDRTDIFGCAVDGCGFSCSSIEQLHGHYHAAHHPDGVGTAVVDRSRTDAINRYFRRLETDIRRQKPLTLPF